MSMAMVPNTLMRVSLGAYARISANRKVPKARNTPNTTVELHIGSKSAQRVIRATTHPVSKKTPSKIALRNNASGFARPAAL